MHRLLLLAFLTILADCSTFRDIPKEEFNKVMRSDGVFQKYYETTYSKNGEKVTETGYQILHFNTAKNIITVAFAPTPIEDGLIDTSKMTSGYTEPYHIRLIETKNSKKFSVDYSRFVGNLHSKMGVNVSSNGKFKGYQFILIKGFKP